MTTFRQVLSDSDKYVIGHVYALESDTVKRLFEEYQRAYLNMAITLETGFLQYGGGNTWSTEDSMYRERTEYLMVQLMREMQRLGQASQDISLDAATSAYLINYTGRAWGMDIASSGAIKMPMLPVEMIRAQISAPYEGNTFVDRFRSDEIEFQRRIRNSIVQSQIYGEDILSAQKRLAQELGINIDRRRADKAAAQRAFNRTQMIARTEIIKSSFLGAQAIYSQNADVIEGWTVGLAYDDRTCETCINANDNDKVYKLGRGPRIPLHPNCRCAAIVAMRDKDMEQRIVGKPPSYKQWAENHNVLQQYGQWLVPMSQQSKGAPKRDKQ